MLKCVIFDVGDTLIRGRSSLRKVIAMKHDYDMHKKYLPGVSEEDYYRALAQAEEKIAQMWGDHSKYKRGFFDKLLFEILGKEITSEQAGKMHDEFTQIYMKQLEPIEHVREILEFCQKKSLMLAVISNHTQGAVEERLAHINLLKFFDGPIITSEEIGGEKSTLKPFVVFLQRTKLKSEECLMVGDREDEDAYAKKVGMHTAIFNPHILEGEPIKGDYYIKDLIELKPIIEKLMK